MVTRCHNATPCQTSSRGAPASFAVPASSHDGGTAAARRVDIAPDADSRAAPGRT